MFMLFAVFLSVYALSRFEVKKLKEEVEYLRTVERPAISRQIAEARDKGDLSENAEYDAAKEAQGILEMRISKLEEVIRKAKIVSENQIDTSKVQIFSKVKIKNLKTSQILEYTIVSETEADLKAGKISVNTPIAQGLIGKSKGQKAEVKAPAGIIEFEIIDISR